MTTTWILIWFVMIGNGITSGSAEFHDKDACLKASQLMATNVGATLFLRTAGSYMCVEKKLHK